jgi:VIT1/CCC1 family predicted Fe2+/Mn2+ transporter
MGAHSEANVPKVARTTNMNNGWTESIKCINVPSRLRDKHYNSFAERSLPMKLNRNLGMLLTGIWLILTGLIPLLSLSFSGLGTLMALLAVAGGALIVTGR